MEADLSCCTNGATGFFCKAAAAASADGNNCGAATGSCCSAIALCSLNASAKTGSTFVSSSSLMAMPRDALSFGAVRPSTKKNKNI